jgi:hypothetical protein
MRERVTSVDAEQFLVYLHRIVQATGQAMRAGEPFFVGPTDASGSS